MKLTNAFLAFERHKDTKGNVTIDPDGACYLQPHSHPLMQNKDGSPRVFCNQVELVQTIRDNNAPKPHPDDGNKFIDVPEEKKFRGEVILLNVMTFE